MRSESAVSSIEDMMTLVEDIACREMGILDPAKCRLDHHQGMVGDDDIRVPSAPDIPFDKATAVMFAGAIDAFATPVGQTERPAAPMQFSEPAGKITAGQITVAGRRGPARHQPQPNSGAGLYGRSAHRFGEVEQAEVIFAAFANHDAFGFFGGIEEAAPKLVIDLVLEVAGIGRHPNRCMIALGPDCGRSKIAERLSYPGAGFGNDRVRAVGAFAGGKSRRNGAGEIRLLRPGLGGIAALDGDHFGKAFARLVRRHRRLTRRPLGWFVFPIRQGAPDIECPVGDLRAGRCTQRRHHRRSPTPAAALHRIGQPDRV